jgi:glycosyltransferase involved in cell wall biosynthesis
VRYPLFEIEVTHPLADLPLSPGDLGAAALIRRKGVPIGFVIQNANGLDRVPAEILARKIVAEVGESLMTSAIQEEIALPQPLAPLPLVTIAICTKDRPQGVERLLLSLREQESALPNGSEGLDVLIVDNAPSDERTRELAALHAGVRYVRESRPGLDFARNRALQEARGEILAFLDDDVIVDRHWSAGLAQAWTENRDAAVYTGQVLPMELETEAQILFEMRGGFRREFHRVRYGPVLPANVFYPGGAGIFGAGANMAFKTAIVRQLGGFDEALDTGAPVPGGGDLDIFYRVIRAGYALVYEPRFLAFHQHRRDMKSLLAQYRRSWGFGYTCYLSKCIKYDPERRANLILLICWWVGKQLKSSLRNLKNKLQGRSYLPPSIFLGELCGGIAGLFGGYAKSVRRVERIRKRFS